MIRFEALGTTGLRGDAGEEIDVLLRQPKRLALLAYLAIGNPGLQRRDTLLGVFWPEIDTENARSALRQTTHFLRAALGKDAVIARGDSELGINAERVWCDAVAFEAALAAGSTLEALDLYHGDLLPGLFIAEAPEFERWLERQRSRLRDRAAAAAWHIAESPSCAPSLAADMARRAAAFAPDDEIAVRRLIAVLARVGDRTSAIDAFEAHAERLRKEYELKPSPETMDLIMRVRAAAPQPTAPHSAPDTVAQSRSRSGVMPELTFPADVTTREDSAPPTAHVVGVERRRRLKSLGTIVGALLVILVTLMVTQRKAVVPTLDLNVLAIAPFEILDPRYEIWSEGLMAVLAANLDGAGPVRTIPPSTVLQGWHSRADVASARHLGRQTGARMVVIGRLLGAGDDSVRATVTMVDAATGRQSEFERRGLGSRIDQLSDSITVSLLAELGQTRAVGAVRFAGLGSRSLPALKAFLQGEQAFRRSEWNSALAAYQRAVVIDTAFAPALRRIGSVLDWSGQAGGAEAGVYHLRAGAANHGVAPRESLMIAADSLGAVLYRYEGDPDWWRHAQRLFRMREETTRRYPTDAEAWYQLGEARFHFEMLLGSRIERVLEPFDRAIALDSAFAPSFIHPVGLALDLGDPARALRYIEGYLQHSTGDVTQDGLRLTAALLDTRMAAGLDTARLPDSIGAGGLFEAWAPLNSWADSLEAGVLVGRWLASRRWKGPPPFDDSTHTARLLGTALAVRGHFRDALAVSGDHDADLFADVASLGGVPEGVANQRFAAWLRTGSRAARGALPFWAARRDTAALVAFARQRLAEVRRGGHVAEAVYEAAAGSAYLWLARGDSGEAIRAMAVLPDSLCPWCYHARLTRVQLLIATGRAHDAMPLLQNPLTGIVSGSGVAEVLWRVAHARAATAIGDSSSAARHYGYVARAWGNGDPLTEPYVREARKGAKKR